VKQRKNLLKGLVQFVAHGNLYGLLRKQIQNLDVRLVSNLKLKQSHAKILNHGSIEL